MRTQQACIMPDMRIYNSQVRSYGEVPGRLDECQALPESGSPTQVRRSSYGQQLSPGVRLNRGPTAKR